jgi:hypothetical protein
MKSAFFKIIIAFAFLSISTSCTFFEKITKEPEHTGQTVKVMAKELNIRIEPNVKSKVISTVLKDTLMNLIEPIDSKSAWCKVEYSNKIGYCSKAYIIEYKEPSNWEVFYLTFIKSFFVYLFLIGSIRYKIKDKRYSSGTRDGGYAYKIGGMLLTSLILALLTAVFWLIYML